MEMSQVIKNVLAALALCQLMQCALAMMCDKEHPQTAVCRASFVMKAKVLSNDWTASNKAERSLKRLKFVRVEVRNIYKGQNLVNATKNSQLNIWFDSYYKPSHFKVGEVYVLTGGNFGPFLKMSVCSWNSLWKDLSMTQKLGINGFYSVFCQCHVKQCSSGSCKQDKKSCMLTEKKGDCQIQSQMCTSWNGRCQWANPTANVKC